MKINKEQLESMLKRRGFNPKLSFAAFDKNQIVAFTFNGIGNFNKIATAYDTDTETLKEYRGKGLATNIFEYSTPYLIRQLNIHDFHLIIATFWNFYPSWQNSFESIVRTTKDFVYMGVFVKINS